MAIENPLSADDLATINTAISDSTDAESLILKAEAAGIDVEQFKAKNNDAKARLIRIKSAFFPGQ